VLPAPHDTRPAGTLVRSPGSELLPRRHKTICSGCRPFSPSSTTVPQPDPCAAPSDPSLLHLQVCPPLLWLWKSNGSYQREARCKQTACCTDVLNMFSTWSIDALLRFWSLWCDSWIAKWFTIFGRKRGALLVLNLHTYIKWFLVIIMISITVPATCSYGVFLPEECTKIEWCLFSFSFSTITYLIKTTVKFIIFLSLRD
jgi:hypothetical protein